MKRTALLAPRTEATAYKDGDSARPEAAANDGGVPIRRQGRVKELDATRRKLGVKRPGRANAIVDSRFRSGVDEATQDDCGIAVTRQSRLETEKSFRVLSGNFAALLRELRECAVRRNSKAAHKQQYLSDPRQKASTHEKPHAMALHNATPLAADYARTVRRTIFQMPAADYDN